MTYPSTVRFFVTRDPNRPEVVKDNTSLRGAGPDVLAYIGALKVGEQVVETTQSAMFGKKGTVYLSKDGGGVCVRWELPPNSTREKATWMGTSVTWGTRRISDTSSQPSPVLEVMYRATPDSEPREFAHIWPMHGWGEENEGKWTFNRSDVCIENEWWPAVYTHATLTDLLTHLESTFIEGVPANQPD